MADSSNRVMRECLLQDGVSAALATLYVIEGADLFNASPADPHDAERHGHGTVMLTMLEDQLRRIQQQVNALSGMPPAAEEGH